MEENKEPRVPRIGDMAPEFHAVTTQGEVNFPKDYLGSWVVLFAYEADFTPVSTTEIMMLASMYQEFKAIGATIICISTDSIYSHIAWLRKIKELSWKEIKHIEIGFPLISDNTTEITRKYNMMYTNQSTAFKINSCCIIDPKGRLRLLHYDPTAVGRNSNEILRQLIALQKTDQDMIVTPVNWIPNEDIILTPPKACKAAIELNDNIKEGQYFLDWFLCFQQCTDNSSKVAEPESNPYPTMFPPRNRNGYRRP